MKTSKDLLKKYNRALQLTRCLTLDLSSNNKREYMKN